MLANKVIISLFIGAAIVSAINFSVAIVINNLINEPKVIFKQ